MAIEQPIRGVNGQPSFLQFGHLPGHKFAGFYANTAGSPLDAVKAVSALHKQYRIRHLIGPYSNTEAEAIADWAAVNMPLATVISFSANTDTLLDRSRFPTLIRICYTDFMYVTALVQAMAARKWTSMVS